MSQLKHMVVSDSTILSYREWSVIRLVGEGLHNRDISQQLGIEEQYVKNLLRAVYRKMKMDRLKVALWYMKYQHEKSIH